MAIRYCDKSAPILYNIPFLPYDIYAIKQPNTEKIIFKIFMRLF